MSFTKNSFRRYKRAEDLRVVTAKELKEGDLFFIETFTRGQWSISQKMVCTGKPVMRRTNIPGSRTQMVVPAKRA